MKKQMEFTVYIEQLKVLVTCSKKDGDYWLIEPAIFHPCVSLLGSYAIANNFEDLKNDLINFNISDPMDISAAIMFKNKPEKFFETNNKLKIIRENNKECCVCLEKYNDPNVIRIMCYNLHWICRNCYNRNKELKKCPLCRFLPFGNVPRLEHNVDLKFGVFN